MLRILVIGPGIAALVPVVTAAQPTEGQMPNKPPLMRPSDLPYYDNPHAKYKEIVEESATKEQISYLQSLLLEPVKLARQSVQTVYAQSSSATQLVKDNINDYQDRVDWMVQYLREEENKSMRYGAVAMGGLTGVILGLRGGIIRRLFYGSIATTIMGTICFPEETSELAQKNGVLAKQYINIAYNFLYGVKPGDPQMELSLPELHIPQNFSEFVDLTKSVAGSVKQAVMPPPAKETSESPKKD